MRNYASNYNDYNNAGFTPLCKNCYYFLNEDVNYNHCSSCIEMQRNIYYHDINKNDRFICQRCGGFTERDYKECDRCFKEIHVKKYKCPTCKKNKSIESGYECEDCRSKKRRKLEAEENRKQRAIERQKEKEQRQAEKKKLAEEKERQRVEKEKERNRIAEKKRNKILAEKRKKEEEERKRVELINRLTKTTRKIEID